MKNPWLALLLSLVVPGLGQAYAGRYDRGFLILGVFLLILALDSFLAFYLQLQVNDVWTWTIQNLLAWQLFQGLGLLWWVGLNAAGWIWVLHDAHRCARSAARS
ncbi:MAG: hypothetical protein HYY05_02760 [Chloroflexi bacterium]|nr:hypothetical protein [Chloroflexota bacterium]